MKDDLLTIENLELPKAEWILLSEETAELDRLQAQVKTSFATLQELERLAGVTDKEKYLLIKNDLTAWIRLQMLNDKEIRKLANIMPIEDMIVPPHLQTVKELFLKEISFEFLKYANGWQVDATALHKAENSLRSFAKTQKQVDRYNAAKSLSDFINTTLTIGVWNRHKFLSELTVWKPDSQTYEPVESFVLADDDAYVN